MITPGAVTAVTVTGTHKTEDFGPWTLESVFARTLGMFNSRMTTWYVGGALGVDTAFLRWYLNAGLGHVKIVVPNLLQNQPKEARSAIEWALGHKALTEALEGSDFPEYSRCTFELIELRLGNHPDAYHKRNRYMVDKSQAVIGFPHETKVSSETYSTLAYAKTLNLPCVIWPVGE